MQKNISGSKLIFLSFFSADSTSPLTKFSWHTKSKVSRWWKQRANLCSILAAEYLSILPTIFRIFWLRSIDFPRSYTGRRERVFLENRISQLAFGQNRFRDKGNSRRRRTFSSILRRSVGMKEEKNWAPKGRRERRNRGNFPVSNARGQGLRDFEPFGSERLCRSMGAYFFKYRKRNICMLLFERL